MRRVPDRTAHSPLRTPGEGRPRKRVQIELSQPWDRRAGHPSTCTVNRTCQLALPGSYEVEWARGALNRSLYHHCLPVLLYLGDTHYSARLDCHRFSHSWSLYTQKYPARHCPTWEIRPPSHRDLCERFGSLLILNDLFSSPGASTRQREQPLGFIPFSFKQPRRYPAG
jgi:hypothetical protein